MARAGFDVTLAEARTFPRPKVCGEFITPAADGLLQALVPLPCLLAAGARPVSAFVLETSRGERSWPLPSPAWAISRGLLDTLLRDAAAAAGARVLQPWTARRVECAEHGIVAHGHGHARAGASLRADVVIHADGIGRHDAAGPIPHDPRLIALKCHLRPAAAPEGVRIRAGRGGYVGTMAVEDGLSVCALSARKTLLAQARGRPDAVAAALWPGFDASARVGRWLSCGVPRSAYRAPGHPRSFRIGNAAAAVDPVGGEGIGLALWAGTALAGLLGAARPVSCAGLRECERAFAALYRARLRARLPSCRAAAWAIERPLAVSAIAPAMRIPGAGIGLWYALTGKWGGGSTPRLPASPWQV